MSEPCLARAATASSGPNFLEQPVSANVDFSSAAGHHVACGWWNPQSAILRLRCSGRWSDLLSRRPYQKGVLTVAGRVHGFGNTRWDGSPQADMAPMAAVTAEVREFVSVIPLASDCKIRLNEPATVTVTAMVGRAGGRRRASSCRFEFGLLRY
jgi:hypothetical protein